MIITHNSYSLSNFLFRSIPSWIIHSFGKVMDKSDALGNTDLLLFGQLSGQASLARCWVVDGYVDLLLHRQRGWGYSNKCME